MFTRKPGEFLYVVQIHPIDGRIDADAGVSRALQVRHDRVEGVAPDLVVVFPHSVQAEKHHIRVRYPERDRPIRNDVYQIEADPAPFGDEVVDIPFSVSPQQGLAAG